jgi:uncharacterized SAM-binding protein YcdF (DUF218 family)
VRRRWQTAAGAVVVAVAAALGSLSPAVSQAEPAAAFPQSPVVVTGGNPQNAETEAREMRNMLILLGFPADRIILEDKANSTTGSRSSM